MVSIFIHFIYEYFHANWLRANRNWESTLLMDMSYLTLTHANIRVLMLDDSFNYFASFISNAMPTFANMCTMHTNYTSIHVSTVYWGNVVVSSTLKSASFPMNCISISSRCCLLFRSRSGTMAFSECSSPFDSNTNSHLHSTTKALCMHLCGAIQRKRIKCSSNLKRSFFLFESLKENKFIQSQTKNNSITAIWCGFVLEFMWIVNGLEWIEAAYYFCYTYTFFFLRHILIVLVWAFVVRKEHGLFQYNFFFWSWNMRTYRMIHLFRLTPMSSWFVLLQKTKKKKTEWWLVAIHRHSFLLSFAFVLFFRFHFVQRAQLITMADLLWFISSFYRDQITTNLFIHFTQVNLVIFFSDYIQIYSLEHASSELLEVIPSNIYY